MLLNSKQLIIREVGSAVRLFGEEPEVIIVSELHDIRGFVLLGMKSAIGDDLA